MPLGAGLYEAPQAGDILGVPLLEFRARLTTPLSIGIPQFAAANTFTATQTIDLGSGALPALISANTPFRLASADGQANRVETLSFGSTALQFNCRLAAGTRSTKSYPTSGLAAVVVNAFAYDEATAGYTSNALARHLILATEAHTATAKGFGHQLVATLNGASSAVVGVWLQGTTGTDPFPTLGIGAAPTAGNGLLQLASGATKAYGIAWGTDTCLYRSAANTVETEGGLVSKGATSGIGYSTGAGGTVTQATSRTTGVTINKVCGSITLVSAAGSAAYQSFTVTNSAVAATDTIVCNQKSGTDKNIILITAVAAGSFQITFATTGGTTVEQPVFNFSVIKAVAA